MKLKSFYQLEEFDLLAKVELIKSEYSGRSSPVSDGYKGQFFWHINDEPCTDWLAMYVFEHGELHPGSSSKCKIILAGTIKKIGKETLKENAQFATREGSRIVGIGKILSISDDI